MTSNANRRRRPINMPVGGTRCNVADASGHPAARMPRRADARRSLAIATIKTGKIGRHEILCQVEDERVAPAGRSAT
ncbi:hypothetical protein [Lacipirellula limnantheis]|uniref:hypothetical protein n=1 Tax=Lacipirellula limnantheis TaxID=2528024 RepID=UPI0011A1E0FC|nr:hypothetical protein [Lacipirellula limnantheis]